MRTIVKALLAAACVAAGPAVAQIQQLPATSRAESQTNSLNNSLATQSQNRGVQQQNQFENNAIRGELSRPSPGLPSPVAPGIVVGR